MKRSIWIIFFSLLCFTACRKQGDAPSQEAELMNAWTGYYSCSIESQYGGTISVDLMIYEEDGAYFGYLAMEGYEHEGEWAYTYPQSRMLTEVSMDEEEVFVCFLQDFSEDVQEDYFGMYQEGDLLFSLRKAPDGIYTDWECLDLEGTDRANAFGRESRLLSWQLQNQEDQEHFLKARGIAEDAEVFYTYYNEDGMLQLKIYYDDRSRTGTGIFYGDDVDGRMICGFGIDAPVQEQSESDKWKEYKLSSLHDSEEFSDIHDYEEHEIRNEQGKITNYKCEGIIGWMEEEGKQTIIETDCYYRGDGTLERKESFYNSWVFGSYRFAEKLYYDVSERLVYTNAYITHGYLEDYYIYEENEDSPSCCLTLDHMGRDVCVWSFIKL